MKQILYANPAVSSTATTTSEALTYDETQIDVALSTGIVAGNYVLIEAIGNEYCEIREVASVASTTSITLSSGVDYPHISGVAITLLDYNKYVIDRSTDGTTYTILNTATLDYSDKHNRIVYDDMTGSDDYYYGIYYKNDDSLVATVVTTGTTDLFTKVGHGLTDGDTIVLSSIVTTTGIFITKVYYIVSVAGNDFQVSLTSGGSAVTLTSDGTCSFTPVVLQELQNLEDDFGWITAADFETQTGISSGSNASYIYEAIRSGVESMRDDLFFNKILETTDGDTQFDLDLQGYVAADFDGNRTIDKNDIIVYEYDTANNLITYLSHKVVKFFTSKNAPKIVFSESVPTSGKTLVIIVPVAQVEYSDYKNAYSEINKLWAANYLLSNTTIDNIKTGILNWTAGGTTVSREPMTVADAMEKNNGRITMLMKDLLLKTYMGSTKLRTRRSILNRRSRSNIGGIRTPSGNVYY